MRGVRTLLAGLAAITGGIGLSACTPQAPAPAAEKAAVEPAVAPAPVIAPAGAPGAEIAAAKALAVGMVDAGEIADKTRSAFYRFDNKLSVRDLAVVRLENESSTLRPYFKIYDENRAQIGDAYNGTPGASVEQTIAIEPGKPIFVEVLPQNSVGKYKLSVATQNAADAQEPNDDILAARPAELGKPIDGAIMDKKDDDFFKFAGAGKAKLSIVLDNQSTTLRPNIKVFNADKALLVEKYEGTAGANLAFTVDTEAGTDVYVAVLNYDSSGKYKLTVK